MVRVKHCHGVIALDTEFNHNLNALMLVSSPYIATELGTDSAKAGNIKC